MLLDQIAGQQRPRAALRRAVLGGTPAHAYLFLGPPSVGKTATALAFAGDLLEAAGSVPLRDGVLHPDLWVEDSDAETISIDVIRKDSRGGRENADAAKLGVPGQPLQGFLSLRGMHTDRRIAVIARAERLREAAASPLLKTIEEPPEGAVLVLCAQAADLLPATIRSRCQVVEFSALTDVELRQFLQELGVELPGPVLRLAQGRPGLALALAADPEGARRRLDWGAALEAAISGSWLDTVRLGARFGGADSARNRALAREALDCWEAWIRDFTAGRAGAAETTTGAMPDPAALAGAADAGPSVPPAVWAEASDPAWSKVDLAGMVAMWSAVREAADRVENNVNPRLAIEVFIADVQRAGAR
ncbi:MAG: polymerase subunit delta [Chloroflexota bacterium]|nr:polymerase subunit delta [Chloroflexota bacterium]